MAASAIELDRAPKDTDAIHILNALLSKSLKEFYRKAPNSMDNSLTHRLRQMIFDYGWQAVLAELAQLSIDHGRHASADLLLQVSYDVPRHPIVHQTLDRY